MTEDRNKEDRRVVTDHTRIRRLAEEQGAEPTAVEGADGSEDLRLHLSPDETDETRITWDDFFDRLEREGQAVQYRPDETGAGSEAVLEVVDRSTHTTAAPEDDPSDERVEPGGASEEAAYIDERGADAGESTPADRTESDRRSGQAGPSGGSTDDPANAETEPIATGDTGDAEPVAFERTESERPERGETDDASTAPAADSGRAPSAATEGLVLDEIHVGSTGPGSGEPSDEYLAFENVGDRPLDLSGWTVENADGRSYRFPPDTVLQPGESVKLHSDAGEATDGHRYWGADESIWGDKEITVTVRTDSGERVLRERYET